MKKFNNWYIEYGNMEEYNKVRAPKSPVTGNQFNVRPNDNWIGPFHCKDCAETCCCFGKTEEDAWNFHHASQEIFLGSA